MSADGIVEVYAKTEDYQFPLVLVIGREANNEDNRLGKAGIGTYDFREHEGCSFWNISFSMYGEANNIKSVSTMAAAVKTIFNPDKKRFKLDEKQKPGCCPIVFSDVCPQGIPSGTKEADAYEKVFEREWREHIENIFSLDKIIKRLALVVLSGHHKELRVASKYTMEQCDEWKIPYVETEFMYGENLSKIMEQLKQANMIPTLQDVHKKFLEETGKAGS